MKLVEMVKEFIVELIKFQAEDNFKDYIRSDSFIPGFISDGAGNLIMLSTSMERIIDRIAAVLHANEPTLARSHTKSPSGNSLC